MNPAITFIIPVRHQENAPDWQRLKQRLSQTIESITAQESPSWQAVIVANEEADLPVMPRQCHVKRVDFPPNEHFMQGDINLDVFRDAVRLDKGRRVLAGLLYAASTGHVMVVDDDDFVSRKLSTFVAAHPRAAGWFVCQGYMWTDGSRFLYKHNEFMHICGTSLIVRADLYDLPASLDSANPDYVRRMFGSHIYTLQAFEDAGHPLAPLPFPGAIYRTGHTGAHSRSKGVFQEYLLRKSVLRSPRRTIDRIRRLRLRTAAFEAEFFGGSR